MPDDSTVTPAIPPPEPKTAAPADLSTLADEYNFDGNVDDAIDTPQAPTPRAPAPKPTPAVTVGGQRPEPAQPKPQAHQHPAYLTKRAEELGMSDEEIASTPTTQLDRDVYQLSRQQLAHEREMARLEVLEQARRRPADPANPPAPETPTEEAIDWGEEADPLSGKKVKISEDQIHPGIVNQFKSMQREIKSLKEQLGGISQREQQRENMTRAQQVDAAFNDMAEDLFGRGTVHDMDPGDLALMRRRMVVDSLKAKPPTTQGTITKHIQTRARELFGLASQQVEEEEAPQPAPRARAAAEKPRNPDGTFAEASLSERQQQWRQGAVAKPTQRDSPGEKKGPRKAERAAAEFMKEHGTIETDEDVMNGFLS